MADIKRILTTKHVIIAVIIILAVIIFVSLTRQEKTGRIRKLTKDDYIESYAPSGPVEDSSVPTQMTGKLYVTPKDEER